MAKVEIYTTQSCPFCVRAKKLLDQKGVVYTEISVDNDPALRRQMQERSGRHTVPQIFINEQSQGGCDDLYSLEASGKLSTLLTE
jgi:glutaredoxin 3